MRIDIRLEKPEDLQKIRKVNLRAFPTQTEADLVEYLRNSNTELISLVAESVDKEVVGHILFSPVSLVDHPDVTLTGLAPMAVAPSLQRKGIGSLLVNEGLRHCLQAGYKAVVVLGHPNFYPRFGFVPSTDFGIKSEYGVPEEVFMVKELKKGSLKGCQGVVKYHPAFNEL